MTSSNETTFDGVFAEILSEFQGKAGSFGSKGITGCRKMFLYFVFMVISLEPFDGFT